MPEQYQTRDVPGMGQVEFPASMTEEQIQAVIKRHAPAQPAQAPAADEGMVSSGPSMTPQDVATGAAYAARAVQPAVNATANFVAGSPIAQRVVGAGVGHVVGKSLGMGELGTIFGAAAKDQVAGIAQSVANATKDATTTIIGKNPATGQVTKILIPSALKQIVDKLFPATGMMSGESAALNALNDPAKVKALIAKLSPEEKAQLFRRMPASFAKEYQD